MCNINYFRLGYVLGRHLTSQLYVTVILRRQPPIITAPVSLFNLLESLLIPKGQYNDIPVMLFDEASSDGHIRNKNNQPTHIHTYAYM